eukprot:Opistho-2@86327
MSLSQEDGIAEQPKPLWTPGGAREMVEIQKCERSRHDSQKQQFCDGVAPTRSFSAKRPWRSVVGFVVVQLRTRLHAHALKHTGTRKQAQTHTAQVTSLIRFFQSTSITHSHYNLPMYSALI